MKKKIIIASVVAGVLLFAIVGVIVLCTQNNQQQNGPNGGNGNNGNDEPALDLELSGDAHGYVITGIGSYPNGDVVIPAEYNGYPVVAISNEAFQNCEQITSVVVPSSVLDIESFAFDGCVNLERVELKNGVAKIGKGAFRNCSKISTIVIPASVTLIRGSAFEYCTSLTNVEFATNSQLAGIESSAFKDCTSLTTITLPASVTKMAHGIFAFCDSLTVIDVDPANTKFKSVDGNVYSYDGKTLVFYAVGKPETTFVIPDGVTTIGTDALAYSKLETVVLSSTLTTIQDYAFRNCKKLSNIEFPNGVTSVNVGAFNACYALTYNEYKGGSYLGNPENPYLILIKLDDKEAASYEVHVDAKVIASRAFSECTALERVVIHKGLHSISNAAFWQCSSMQTIEFEGTLKEWKAIKISKLGSSGTPTINIQCSDETITSQ